MGLSGISAATTGLTSLGGLIVVSPQDVIGYQPQNFPSFKKDLTAPPPALLFNYEGEQTVALSSDITDHFIENNTAIQDQISLKPEIITTSGFIGELNNVAPRGLQTLKFAADKLTALSPYTPQLSATALLAYNDAVLGYSVAKNLLKATIAASSSLVGLGGSSGLGGQGVINGSSNVSVGADGSVDGIGANRLTQTNQQIYFQQFYGYWKNRTLFTVQTPWAVFQDMAIQSLRAIQDAETRMISDFEITFKLLRFATTNTVVPGATLMNGDNFQLRASNQFSPVSDNGDQTLQVA
jgi:hypothetical protein